MDFTFDKADFDGGGGEEGDSSLQESVPPFQYQFKLREMNHRLLATTVDLQWWINKCNH